MDETLRALNRFGLGARIGERVGIGDPRGWVEAQLDASPPELDSAGQPSHADVAAALGALRRAQIAKDTAAVGTARTRIREILVAEMGVVLRQRLASDRPFVERLVAFWSNHLCVSVAAKVLVAPLAGLYEREAIRPHVLGRFDEMVLATARHPAMLIYLDNARSVGPDSHVGRRPGRGGSDRGLNENYARELLELHTLGVDGGYTQKDVQELARILTGWTANQFAASGTAGAAGFAFRPAMHDPGTKTVLGVRYAEAGVEEGEAVIRALCRHASTARFIAGKLVRHLVSDDPPRAAVDAVARTFADTDGDLREVARTLVRLEAAWEGEGRKFRTPQDWFVAALRALRVRDAQEAFPQVLNQLRHPLWAPGSPKGYGDTAREWADPDALMNRAELARTIARRIGRAGLDPRELLEVVDVAEADPLRTLLADESIGRDERVALALAGPAFQWR